MSKPLPLPPWKRCTGALRVPGDKSISHRALLFAAAADGESCISGLAPGDDVATTRRAVTTLGAGVADDGDIVVVTGGGWAGLAHEGSDPLDIDCGNSGTTARLLCGLLAGVPGNFRLTGDASLSRRPMGRVVLPLAELGATIAGGDTLPLTITGTSLRGRPLELAVASAQVKSACLLAALQATGGSSVHEPHPTRDHTERLLRFQGAPVSGDPANPGRWEVPGGAPTLAPFDLAVPGDPSSAAYAVALACLLPDSEVRVEGLCLNPRRLGFVQILTRMGAAIACTATGHEPEPVGTLTARSGGLRGVTLTAAEVVDAIDELPLISVVGALADGVTVIRGAGELRKKECDRIAETVKLLRAFGASVEEHDDGLTVTGGAPRRGAAVDSADDHRIAMCAAVAAACAEGESSLSGAEWVSISYPGFFDDLESLRA